MLLYQKPRPGQVGNALFLLVLGLPMMLVVLAREAPLAVKLGLFFLGIGLASFAAVMLWRHWMRVFLQERGIREYRQRRGRSLPYVDVDELTYSSTRIFMHGSYIQTVQKLALKSDGMTGPPLVCTHRFREPEPRSDAEARTALTDVRNLVGLVLAERLSQRLEREGAIPWTPELSLRRTGLECLAGGTAVRFIEWRRVRDLQLDQGKMRLWLESEDKPSAESATDLPNFYPGYLLADRLRRGALD